MNSSKFAFDIEYQFEIIRFIILDKKGASALQLVEDNYFALPEHQVLIYGLKKFYSKVGRVPRNKVNFKAEIKKLFKTKRYAQAFKEEDRKAILKLVDQCFKGVITDSDIIYENCKKFASFIQVKKVVETFDITDFNQYESASAKLARAVTVGVELDEENGEFLYRNLINRQFNRKHNDDTIPTPYTQINRLTNGDGFPKGSLITIIDKGKGGKTCMLVNIGRGYNKQRKKVVVFDLENGEQTYAMRYEQSLVRGTKREVKQGVHDDKLSRLARKYMRLNCETVIRRVPAFTTTRELDKIMDDYKSQGYVFDVAVIDYIGLMGSLSGATDDTKRISDAYVDVKNWALKWDLDIVWTGHHVTREAYKRRAYRYEPTDTAKCIDINRHIDAMFGINQNDQEKEAGVWRLEVVDIRDGLPDARAYFWEDINTQRVDEFTQNQLKEYKAQMDAGGGAPKNKEKAKASSNKGKNADI